jgi:LPS-assembly lipoprotein
MLLKALSKSLKRPGKLSLWLVICLTTMSLLSGCGFTLRGSHQIANSLKVMHFDPADKYAELARLLRTQLSVNEIELIGRDKVKKRQAATLRLEKDRLDRRTLSLFPNGQVAEYELIYTVNYTISVPEQETQRFNVEIYRDYQDDPESALAKSKELKLILKEMRQQAADKIVRQLASLGNSTN